MDTRASPIESAKKVVEVITTHTEFVPPEALGFSVYDDAVVPALSSSFRASASSSSAPSSSALRPAADVNAAPDPVPAAADEQELPAADREVGVEVREVLIDGVKLDSNSPLNTLRGACQSLGLSKEEARSNCCKDFGNTCKLKNSLQLTLQNAICKVNR